MRVGHQGEHLFIIHIGTRADRRHARLHLKGAEFDHRNIQQLDKLAVSDAKRYAHAVIVVGCALEAGKAAAVAVVVNSIADGVDKVFTGNRSSVRKAMLVLGIEIQRPDGCVVVAGPGPDDIGNHLKIVVNFHHMLIDQAADQLIRVVCRDKRVFRIIGIGIQREYIIRRDATDQVTAAGRLRNLAVQAASVPAATAGKAEQDSKGQKQSNQFFCS